MNSRHLAKGDVRFILLFADKDLTIPVIQTLIYERSENTNGTSSRYFFRDVSSENNEPFFVNEDDFDDLILDICGLYKKIGQIL